MRLAEFSIKNSLVVNLISLVLILVGIFCILDMRREAFPNVSFDIIKIDTTYRGATADEIERLITHPLEKELRGVDGIDEVQSVSVDNNSIITLKLYPEIKDKNRVVADVQKAVDRVEMPTDADEPVVKDIQMKEYPVVIVVLRPLEQVDEAQLQGLADILADRLEDIDGVAKIRKEGYRDKQIWVEVSPKAMKDNYISLEEVVDALKRHNITIPAGKVRDNKLEYSIRTSAEFYTPEEISNVVIRANDAGESIRISDIAKVHYGFEENDVILRAKGRRAISLVVINKEKADAIKVVDDVNRVIKEFKNSVSDKIDIHLVDDISYYIRRRLNVLRNNGLLGFILVLVTLFMFLNIAPALMTALGIPLAIFTTFIIMSIFDISINLLTMFGLIMVLGMLVDDGIIISENIARYIEDGLDRKQASIKGSEEVMLPVVSTILTTIVAFFPLMFMKGIIGKFVKVIPQVVIVALVASMIEAFIILPAHMSGFFLSKRAESPRGNMLKKRWLNWLTTQYTRLLSFSLRWRYLVIAVSLLCFFGALYVGIKTIPIQMFTGRGVELFMIKAKAPVGTSKQKMEKMMEAVERIVERLPKSELDYYITEVGRHFERRGYDPNARMGSNYAQVTVYLTPFHQRRRSSLDIVNALRPAIKTLSGFEDIEVISFVEGPPVGRPIELKIRGEDFSVLKNISEEVKEFLSNIDGVYGIVDNYEFGKLELRIFIDEHKARSAGISVGDIAQTIRNAFEGSIATTIRKGWSDREIEVIVKLPESSKKSIDIFGELLVPNNKGSLIPLKKVVRLKKTTGLSSIWHLDGKRVITITAEIDTNKLSSYEVNRRLDKRFTTYIKNFPGYNIIYGGQQKETQESLFSLGRAFLIALMFIYIILVAQFKSLLQPIIIMLAIPLSIIGVVIAFYIHKEPLSFLGLMGLIGLAGVVVNDSIVLMDFTNRLIKNGIEAPKAVLIAGRLRFRPVLLTTITTVLGLMPTAYGIGGFDPFLRPMALAISWGLLFATILTLIVIPCSFAITSKFRIKRTNI